MATLGDVLVFLIERGPGRTEQELAEAIYGPGGYQQEVNGECRLLVQRGHIERRGEGGQADSYRYFLSDD